MKKFKFIFIAVCLLFLSSCAMHEDLKGTLIWNFCHEPVTVSIGDETFVLNDSTYYLTWNEYPTYPVITADFNTKIDVVKNYSFRNGTVTKYEIIKSKEYKYEIKNASTDVITVQINKDVFTVPAGDTVNGSVWDEKPELKNCVSGNFKRPFTETQKDGITYFYVY